MTITLNGKTLDYSLEGETILGEVISSLSSWLEEANMLIRTLDVDGVRTQLAENEWRNRSLESIDNLDIHAVTLQEGRLIQLQTARAFFDLFNEALETKNKKTLEELSKNYDDLRAILPNILEDSSSPTLLKNLDEALSQSGFPLENGSGIHIKETVHEAIRTITAVLENREKELGVPETNTMTTAKKLAELANNLDDVAIQLQTGQDQRAMGSIILLTELLQTFHKSITGQPGDIMKITEDLKVILGELEEALKMNDTVLIGDLLEYELKPRLMSLPEKLQAQSG